MKFRLNLLLNSLRRLIPATLAVSALSVLAGASVTALAAAAVDVGASQPDVSAPTAASGALTYKMPTWATYYSDIDAIRADSAKAQAELDNLKIHHELEQASHGNFSNGGSGTPNLPAALPMMLPGVGPTPQPAASVAAVVHDPIVEQVSMVDNQWSAVIRMPSGARLSAHQGQTVRGIGKITAISLNQVIATDGAKTTALEFASDQAQESAATTASQPTRPTPMPTPMPFGVR